MFQPKPKSILCYKSRCRIRCRPLYMLHVLTLCERSTHTHTYTHRHVGLHTWTAMSHQPCDPLLIVIDDNAERVSARVGFIAQPVQLHRNYTEPSCVWFRCDAIRVVELQDWSFFPMLMLPRTRIMMAHSQRARLWWKHASVRACRHCKAIASSHRRQTYHHRVRHSCTNTHAHTHTIASIDYPNAWHSCEHDTFCKPETWNRSIWSSFDALTQ